VWRLRGREAGRERPFRFRGGRPLALVLTILFGLLALVASVSVGKETSPVPLLIIAGVAGLVTVYVFTYVPRLERREAAELAARRAARAAERAARQTETEDADP
jgi:hypothetical protein